MDKGNLFLVKKLNDGLSAIKSSGKYDEIYERWFGSMGQKTVLTKRIVIYILWGLIIVLVVTSTLFTWNRTLKAKVARRTQALNKQLARREEAERNLFELNQNLEKKVAQRTKSLEELNKELEAFNYSVSHDLRSPLRIINGYANTLLEEFDEKLGDEALRKTTVIKDHAVKMGQLIEGLLTFSKLGKEQLKPFEFDMKKLCEEVIQELFEANSKSEVNFSINQMPSAFGDRHLLKQVWTNVIENAIKFTSKEKLPKIDIGGSEIENENVYYIIDNGVGFDMKYEEKLFGVFERLHSEKEFKGTGIGLALVQRIIKRHGGRVWASGKPNGGAKICFALPRKQA